MIRHFNARGQYRNEIVGAGAPSAGDDSRALLATVLGFINSRSSAVHSSPLNAHELQAATSAAAQILATSVPGILDAETTQALERWAAGRFSQNEVIRPQLVAAVLLWAEIWKRGS